MGLDMYAYLLKQEAAPVEQVNVDVIGCACKYLNVAVMPLTDEQWEDREEVETYREKVDKAVKLVKKQGIYGGDFVYWRKFNHLHSRMRRSLWEYGLW